MTKHDDARAALEAAAGEYEESVRQVSDLMDELAASRADVTQALKDLADAEGERDAALKKYDDHMTQYHGTTPPPNPEPTKSRALIGSSAPADVWNARKNAVGAYGGEYEARRLFASSLAQDKSSEFKVCNQQQTVPVFSLKPGPYSWAELAAGKGDAILKQQAARIKAAWGDMLIYVAVSHEPGKQELGPTQGEAGPASDFPKMYSHVIDVLKPLLPKAMFGPIMNGWMWSSQARGFSDPELAVWLPKSLLDKLDFVAADDYNNKTGEKAIVRVKNRVAWAKRVGFTGPLGIGETNAWTAEDLSSVFNYVKTEHAFDGGFVLVWDSVKDNPKPDDFRPLAETGLVETIGKIVAGWR